MDRKLVELAELFGEISRAEVPRVPVEAVTDTILNLAHDCRTQDLQHIEVVITIDSGGER